MALWRTKSAKRTLKADPSRVLVNSPMTSILLRLRRPAATLLPLLALGCAGGQTGEETTIACRETRAALGEAADSELGFGADEVLAAASARSATLEWLVTNPLHGPESGTVELSISLEPLGTAVFVQSRAADGSEKYPCADRVEVDVQVTLATSGGALAEMFEDKLRASEPTLAELSHAFEEGNVAGALSFDAASLAGRRVTNVSFDASFAEGALSGALSAGIEQVSGETASLQELTIACFGRATDRCPAR
jgi:hypothetical protein